MIYVLVIVGEQFETYLMKNTSADIINVNTIKHTWVRFSSK